MAMRTACPDRAGATGEDVSLAWGPFPASGRENSCASPKEMTLGLVKVNRKPHCETLYKRVANRRVDVPQPAG